MAAKKHHYLPQFLIRRFAQPGPPPFVWRLDKKSGRTRLVPPKSQAARHQYYRMEVEGAPFGPEFPEQTLSRIESLAAPAITRIASGALPSLDERHALALFAALQHVRTPAGRRELRFMDEFAAKMQMELKLGNRSGFAQRMRDTGHGGSDEELEELRQRTLRDLREGQVDIESTEEREIGLMFMSLDVVAPTLLSDFDWIALHSDSEACFVLPDVGLGRIDPTPRHRGAGTGWASSPNSETTLPIDPRACLLVRPGEGRFGTATLDARAVEDVNVRSYAASEVCYFGQSQEAVTSVRRVAKRDRRRVAAYRPRPSRIWITEGERETGPLDFIGHSLDGRIEARFVVQPGAHRSD
jgi:hypothetical protein